MLLGRDPNLDDLLALRFGVSHSRLLGFSHGHRAERARFQRVRYGRWLRGVLGGGLASLVWASVSWVEGLPPTPRSHRPYRTRWKRARSVRWPCQNQGGGYG